MRIRQIKELLITHARSMDGLLTDSAICSYAKVIKRVLQMSAIFIAGILLVEYERSTYAPFFRKTCTSRQS
jgi:hypothetical protein